MAGIDEFVAPANELCRRSATELAALLRAGEVSAREVMAAHLERIEVTRTILNAFCFVYAEEAQMAAKAADDAFARGADLPPLHGVPIAIKDFTPTAGRITTRGSVGLRDWVPDHDAPIVERLRAAGTIVLGKTTTSEFAHSSFTRSILWGVTRNPLALDRTPGGSSGGSAAAVAAGCIPLAEGSDAGGSIRIPAACCGVVGFKPSFGRIPRHSTDNDFDDLFHHGPLARTVADAALFVQVTQGRDVRDPRCLDGKASLPPQWLPDLHGVRIAVSPDLGHYNVDATVAANLARVAELARDAGAIVHEVELDWGVEVSQAWVTLWAVALAAQYGTMTDALGERTDPALRRLITIGRSIDAVAAKRLDLVRTQQWSALQAVLVDHEVMLCPTLAIEVPPVEGFDDDSFGDVDVNGRMNGFDMTAPFNLIGACPVLSMSSGVDRVGVPTGVQVVGHQHDDTRVLLVAAVLEALMRQSGAGS